MPEAKLFFEKDTLRTSLQDSVVRSSIREDILRFIKSSFEDCFMNVHDELKELKVQAVLAMEKYFVWCFKQTHLEERLEAIKNSLAERDFDEEFEKISGMEPIGTIRVARAGTKPRLIIKTKRIFQIPYNSENKYELGEFEFEIDPFSRNQLGIFILQSRQRGYYKHYHATFEGTCFGNILEEGLNASIAVLMREFNIVPLVHLLLSFLIKEKTCPLLRSSSHNITLAGRSNYETASYKPSPDNFYDNQEDRQQAKTEFVEFLKEVAFKNSAAETALELEKVRNKTTELREQKLANYDEIKETECYLDFLEERVVGADNHDAIEADNLLNDPDVFWITVVDNALSIYFDLAVSQRNSLSKEEIPGYVMTIKHNTPTKLLCLMNACVQDGNIAKSIIKELEIKVSEENFEKKITELQIKGKIYDLLVLIKNMILTNSELEVKKRVIRT